jgi:hypothetical protein
MLARRCRAGSKQFDGTLAIYGTFASLGRQTLYGLRGRYRCLTGSFLMQVDALRLGTYA